MVIDMNWRKELKEHTDQFRAEADGRLYAVDVFDASLLEELTRRGDDGDMQARRVVLAFLDWNEGVEQAMADGVMPGCFACRGAIERGGVAAIAYLEPLEAGSIAAVMVMCPECRQHLTQEQAAEKAMRCIEEQISADVTTLPMQ
jgi:hypothetical protein